MSEQKNMKIVRWTAKIVTVGIFTAVGWLPKFTGQAGALADKLVDFGGTNAVYGIAAMEVIAIILLLMPKTALYGALLAVGLMLGAIGSHVAGPVGMEGEFFGVFIMAIVALVTASTAALLEWKRPRG